jgi:hypothetical protein
MRRRKFIVRNATAWPAMPVPIILVKFRMAYGKKPSGKRPNGTSLSSGPGGMGEAEISAIVPAVTNAIFAATQNAR